MLVPWCAPNRRHLDISQCAKGKERKLRWNAEEELQNILERAFQAYG